MLIVGLTGSIAMGKSTAAARFSHHDIAVLSADKIVHELYEGRACAQIEAAFPGTVMDGRVDRRRLAEKLDKDKTALERLEAIVHPMVREAENKFLARQAARGAVMAVLEIPLLFESGRSDLFDVIIVMSAPLEIQRQRALARPGMSEQKFNLLLSRQLSDEEKKKRADFLVDSSGTIEQTAKQIDKIIVALAHRTGTAWDRRRRQNS